MLRVDAAVIGGTGIGELLAARSGRAVTVPTEFGAMRGRLIEHEGKEILAVQRHSAGHRTPPHLINYRAIAAGVRALGVRACFSSAAVGSLNAERGPGTVAICTDMIDLTGRHLTLFQRTVSHTDLGDAFPLSPLLLSACTSAGLDPWEGVTYVGANGPRYETPSEIRSMQGMGGDVVGMTASSEAVLFREARVPYGCLAVVTNLAAGLAKSELRHGEVTDVMKSMAATVTKILLDAAVAAGARK